MSPNAMCYITGLYIHKAVYNIMCHVRYCFSSLLFMLLITVVTAIGFIFFIGRDIRDVELYYHSEDSACAYVVCVYNSMVTNCVSHTSSAGLLLLVITSSAGLLQ